MDGDVVDLEAARKKPRSRRRTAEPPPDDYEHSDLDNPLASWARLRISGKQKKPKACLANALQVLGLHPAWRGVIAYDAFAECIVCATEPPVREQDAPGTSMIGEWTDEHSTRTAAWIAQVADFDAPTTMVDQAVAALARKRVVHPVRDYLHSLKWDGTVRLPTFLATYFGTADTPYTQAIGTRWLISAVARVMKPGCQADCMLVLEGKQGQKKSTGLEALCADPTWFADTGLDLSHKDALQSLRRKWIYEFGELDSIKRGEITKVKNFVSARVDNYRPSYGKRTRDFLRQLVFAGTTNEESYLVDRTGNRRFWPVACTNEVKVEAIRKDRDQIWAEARTRYLEGERWHVDSAELVKLCQAEQKAREAPDDWVPLVSEWLSLAAAQQLVADDQLTTAKALLGAIEMRKADINIAASTRMGRVLRECGLVPTDNAIATDEGRARVYRQPPKIAPNVTEAGS